MDHHIYSPSSLERRLKCPGSFHLEQGLRAEDISEIESDDAKEGTDLHSLVVACWHENEILETMEDKQKKNKIASCLTAIQDNLPTTGTYQVLFEHKLSLYGFKGEELTYGYADCIIVPESGDTGVLIDFKFGHREVSGVNRNIQLGVYSAAAMQFWGLDYIKTIVFNPTIRQIDKFEYSQKDIQSVIRTVLEIKNQCENEAASQEYNVGDHCSYCLAKLICPKLNEKGMVLKQVHPKDIVSPQRMFELLDDWKVIKKKGEELEFRAKSMAFDIYKNNENATLPNGYKLIKMSGRQEIKDIMKAWSWIQDNEILSLEEFLAHVKINVSSFKKAVAKAMKELKLKKTLKAGEETIEKLEFVEHGTDSFQLRKGR